MFTQKTLKSLTKPHIFDLALKMQHHNYSAISKLIDEIKNLNTIFKRLESDFEAGEKWTIP